jgi:hypothetical protein
MHGETVKFINFEINKSPKKSLVKSGHFRFSPLFRCHAVAEGSLRHDNRRPHVIIKQVTPRPLKRNVE